MSRIRVWDLPTRLFHWLLVTAVGAAWTTGELGGIWLIWHGRIGLFIVGLIAFRLVWGLVGSTYARFGTFVRGPAVIRDYLQGRWHGLGHNPLGALSVLALLALVAAQASSGLFAESDDIAYTGYLHPLASSRFSHLLTEVHETVFNVLLVFIAVHIAAIVFYTHVKKDNLLKPMLSGDKECEQGQAATGGGIVAFTLALSIAIAVVYLASGALLPAPVAAPPPASNW